MMIRSIFTVKNHGKVLRPVMIKRNFTVGQVTFKVKKVNNDNFQYNCGQNVLTINHNNNNVSDASASSLKFNCGWLLDHCSCSNCRHPTSKQKLTLPQRLNLNPIPTKVTILDNEDKVEVDWKFLKGEHKSTYSIAWLKRFSLDSKQGGEDVLTNLQPKLWYGTELNKMELTFDYEAYMNNTDTFKQTILKLNEYGICFIKNVPPLHSSVTELGKKIGPIYSTFYGEDWDVKTDPQAKNIAYTSVELGLHMDLLYFESPPGIQLLHCLENDVKGGDSIFSDGQLALKLLQTDFLGFYKILSKIPVLFQYKNESHHLELKRTIIKHHPTSPQLFYSPPFHGPLQFNNLNSKSIQHFYKAYQQLSKLLNLPQSILKTKLEPGDAVLFNNRRILHGRTKFTSSNKNNNIQIRHFKGTYVSRDAFHDKLRILTSVNSTQTE